MTLQLLADLMAGNLPEPTEDSLLWDAALQTSKDVRARRREIYYLESNVRYDERQIADPAVSPGRRRRFEAELEEDRALLAEAIALHLSAARADVAAWAAYYETQGRP